MEDISSDFGKFLCLAPATLSKATAATAKKRPRFLSKAGSCYLCHVRGLRPQTGARGPGHGAVYAHVGGNHGTLPGIRRAPAVRGHQRAPGGGQAVGVGRRHVEAIMGALAP